MYTSPLYLLASLLVVLLPQCAASRAGLQAPGPSVRVATPVHLRDAIRRGEQNIIVVDHMDLRMLPSFADSSASLLVQTNFTISVRPLRGGCRVPCEVPVLTVRRRCTEISHSVHRKHPRVSANADGSQQALRATSSGSI